MYRASILLAAATVVLLVFASAVSAQQHQGESSMSGEQHSMKGESGHTASALPRTGGPPLVGPVILLAILVLGALIGAGFAALTLVRRGVS
jgi:ABC-type Fe3+-siderophore transport system permease subunit